MTSLGAWVQRLFQHSRSFTPVINDRRRDFRMDLSLDVTVRAGPRSVCARTVNMASGGILIDQSLPLRAGAVVEVTFAGYGRTVSGHVTRVGANSAAIALDSGAASRDLMAWAAANRSIGGRTSERTTGVTAPAPGKPSTPPAGRRRG